MAFRVGTSFDDAKAAVEALGGYPVIFKPTDLACGQNVQLIENASQLERACGRLFRLTESYLHFKPSGRFLIEQFIDGPEFSVEVLLRNKGCIFGSVTLKRTSGPPFFIEMGHVVPAPIPREREKELIGAATTAIIALGFTDGPFHVELRDTPTGVAIMETNGRPGGDRIATDLLPLAFGVDLFGATLDMHLNRGPTVISISKRAAAIKYLFAEPTKSMKQLPHWPKHGLPEGIADWTLPDLRNSHLKPTKVAPESVDSRAGHVIGTGATPAEAEASADLALMDWWASNGIYLH